LIFLRNVLRAPARSAMTALGVAAGVALFVAISAITIDVRNQIAGAASAYNLDVVAYEKRATSPFSSRISTVQMQQLSERYGPTLSPLVLGTRNEKWSSYALILGVTPEFVKRIPLSAGEHHAAGRDEVMIGEIAAQRLGLQPGQPLTVDGREHRVTGVFRTGSRLLDGGVMTGIEAAQDMLTREGAERQFSLALMRARDQRGADSLIADVNRTFPTLRAIPGTEFAGALRLMRVVDAFVRTLSVIAIVGTCLVVSNTLIMAIAERTRDIGILMTVGWTPLHVLRMFLAESLLLCVAGAALGNVFALGLLRVVNSLESVGFGWIPIRFPFSLTVASFVMAIAVAVVSLAWPAVILWRFEPIAAIRHE
jgi:putative ABC transport system permease protein